MRRVCHLSIPEKQWKDYMRMGVMLPLHSRKAVGRVSGEDVPVFPALKNI